jgi:hypothetical protein
MRKPGILAQLLAAIRAARCRRADGELKELLASRGGAMNDRCCRESPRQSRRTHPFRQLPAIARR